MDDPPDIPGELAAVLDRARSLGFLGPGPLADHVAHARGFAAAYRAAQPGLLRSGGAVVPGRWLDLGSGGGLPGLVLALCWPDSEAVLLDSAERRTSFLVDAVRSLGWTGRVTVLRARAEEAGRRPDLRGRFDVVVARSFGAPPVTAECAAPFLCPGGVLLVSEPPTTAHSEGESDRRRWPPEGLAAVGQAPGPFVRNRFGYQVVRQVQVCPDQFPRRVGLATKRPLYQVTEPG